MMDLRVSVVLLFFFITGGYSLKCYSCEPDYRGYCHEKEETCSAGSQCAKVSAQKSSFSREYVVKGCVPKCGEATIQTAEGTVSTYCCDTDLCNAADGVYKGSFLLLVSPLLFYFLFQ